MVGPRAVSESARVVRPLLVFRRLVEVTDVHKRAAIIALLATTMLWAYGSDARGQVSIGITIGPPPAPRVVRVAPPPPPAPGYVWVGGYWYPVKNRYRWHEGYWTRPSYEGARWVAPRHDGQRFYEGYWEGSHGRREHDHKSDKRKDRDFRRRVETRSSGLQMLAACATLYPSSRVAPCGGATEAFGWRVRSMNGVSRQTFSATRAPGSAYAARLTFDESRNRRYLRVMS
jgi:hypothetical protein